MGIGAGQGYMGFRDIHLGESTGHTDIDLPHLAVALLLRLGDGLLKAFINLGRIVPAILKEAVIGHDARAHDIAALGAAVLSNQGHDLARTEIKAHHRGLHVASIPPVFRLPSCPA